MIMTWLSKIAGIESDDELVRRVRKGDGAAFNTLLDRHDDLLQRKVNAFRRAPVPPVAVYAQAAKIVRQAADRYEPGTGAQFRTYLESNLRLTRFVNNLKNVARIPEHRALMIGRYQTAKALLGAEKDRTATPLELAQHLGWSLSDVERLETALSRRELAGSAMQYDQVASYTERMDDTADMLYYALTPEEQSVFDYSLGRHGKTRLKTVAEITKATGLSQDKVYAIKRQLAKRLISGT